MDINLVGSIYRISKR